MSPDAQRPAVGFIGLGDQGLPMATAIAEAGFPLHVWARRQSTLAGFGDTSYTAYDSAAEMAAKCDVVGLCVSTDEATIDLVNDQLLGALRSGSIIVNHGTGTPRNAQRLTDACAPAGVEVLDAPVSGGRPAAEARELTTLVGGADEAVERCRPVFESFSAHIVHIGPTGAGQMAKLFNNAMMLMNWGTIAQILELAGGMNTDPAKLVDSLKLGSAASTSLMLINTMVTPDTVQHLSELGVEDIKIFAAAMSEAGVAADSATKLGMDGAQRMPEVIARLNP